MLHSPSLVACIKERLPVLKGRAPPHRPRGRASTEVYISKLAPTMGPMKQAAPCRQIQLCNPFLSFSTKRLSGKPESNNACDYNLVGKEESFHIN
eukprot:586564-Pelagomonas_calceolata.AAC.1